MKHTLGDGLIALSIGEILPRIRGGFVRSEVDRMLGEAVDRCQETGKKATVTITLELQPSGEQNREINISAKLASKLPARMGLNDSSVFWAERGKLYAEDPAASRTAANAVARASGFVGVDDDERLPLVQR